MSSVQKPPVNWWYSECQKPRNVIANGNMLPVSDGWFLIYNEFKIQQNGVEEFNIIF